MKGYYVTLRDAGKTAWLLGPFSEHEKALAAVNETVEKAYELVPKTWFMAHGTSSIERDAAPLPEGKLNRFLPHLLAS